MTEIRIPKLNNNDQTYTLVEWLTADEGPVQPGDALATLETSKAAEDLVCDESGLLWQAKQAGSECQPGDVIGWVVAPGTERTPDTQRAQAESAAQPESGADDGPLITRDAQALIDELAIGADQLRKLGNKVVRAADIRQLAAEDGSRDRIADGERPAAEDDSSARTYKVPAVQQAVSRTVQFSHQSIPAAYTVVKVDVGAAQAAARQLGSQLKKLVGLPEFLIAAVAPLYEEYPLFFATPKDDRTMLLAEDSHVGLTIDAGSGLFVPVIKNASTRSIEEIAGIVAEFRLSASRGRFREQDLSGGNISIALHRDPDIVLAIPLIFPGQVCCLALAGAQQEAVVGAEGTVSARTVANIGLAYDHRYINGGQVLPFLQTIKEILESPERLSGAAKLAVAEEAEDQRVDHVGPLKVTIVPAPGNFLVPAAGNALGYLTAEERRDEQVVLEPYDQAR